MTIEHFQSMVSSQHIQISRDSKASIKSAQQQHTQNSQLCYSKTGGKN